MLTSVSLSSTITSRKMWELVARVIGANTDELGSMPTTKVRGIPFDCHGLPLMSLRLPLMSL